MPNPFTPNFGQVPYAVVGRDEIIEEVAHGFDNAPGDPALTSLLIGARGTGKTALLTLLSSIASSQGWVTVSVPCAPDMLENIIQGAAQAAQHLINTNKKAHLTGFGIGQLLTAEWEVPTQEQTWFLRLRNLIDLLEEQGVGLLITIDEIDPSFDELVQFASYYQLLLRENRKVSLLMAGLPDKVTALLGAGPVSFLRRASQYRLSSVAEGDIRYALQQTAESSHKVFAEGALDLAVSACNGFPYMIQLVGYRSWQAGEDLDCLGEKQVEKGIRRAQSDMESRVLRSTLDELSDKDLAFLEAMLEDEKFSAVSDVAERMGQSASYVSQYRRRLIDRGVIATRGRGRVMFALPFLREYLPQYLEEMG